MMIQDKLNNIKNALLSVSTNVYHYEAPPKRNVPYIVWYEEGETTSVEANNHKIEQAIGGWIELFTNTEFDPLVDAIQTALNDVDGLTWNYSNVMKGDPTEDDSMIHHTWEFDYG